MRVLVTGATGFVGREIVSELVKNQHHVIGLSRLKNASGENVAFFQTDIVDEKSVEELNDKIEIEAVIHSAGLAHQFGETTKEEFDAVNVTGTENILKLAVEKRVRHFILIGSTAIYGGLDDAPGMNSKSSPIDESAPVNPPTLYAASKLEAENVCLRICEENKIPLTIFRLAPVIGEDNTGNVARLIAAIDRNRFVWIGDGRNLKSLIYKNDVARACVKLIAAKRYENRAEIFNLAAEPIVLKDFVGMIAKHLNKKIPPFKIPALLPRFVFRLNKTLFKSRKVNKISATVEKWLADDVYSADKIAAEYDFRAQTPIAEAIERQVADYRRGKNK